MGEQNSCAQLNELRYALGRFFDVMTGYMAPRGGGGPFSTGCLWQRSRAGVCSLHKALSSALVAAVSRLR